MFFIFLIDIFQDMQVLLMAAILKTGKWTPLGTGNEFQQNWLFITLLVKLITLLSITILVEFITLSESVTLSGFYYIVETKYFKIFL